jgi:hypothetical protein
MARGLGGPAGQSGDLHGGLGSLGRTQERNQMDIWFQISNEFGFWKDFEKVYKEI